MPGKFSFFKGGIKITKPSKDIGFKEAVELIGSDTYKENIEKLRSVADNKSTYEVYKGGLDYFTFSGTFKKRNNESLIKHSGIIGLDLDPYRKNKGLEPELTNPRLIKDFIGVGSDLQKDVHVFMCFISPSGTGYKVLVKINPKAHKESFDQIKAYFFNTYQLNLDAGVNDVARACFVSHDPDIYFNEKSETYKVEAAAPKEPVEKEPKDIPTHQITGVELRSNTDRAKYVAEQVERDRIDITADYDDWLKIGFSLATMGEDGRAIFHRVSYFHVNYKQEEADKKFDDFLKNGRFKTPAKFFAIAKLHGLLIAKPRTIAEKKEEADLNDIIGNDDNASDYIKFGLWEQDQTYWSLDPKGKKYNISNFILRILYHVQTSDQEAYRMIEIKNIWNVTKVVQMNTDDFVSVGAFKKIVARQGNFIFKGTDVDLCRLQDKLQRDEMPTSFIEKLGYDRRGNFYAFANGLWDINKAEFVPTDEQGIVRHYRIKKEETLPQNYFIPALSSMFKDKDNMYTNDKRFVYIPSNGKFKDWAKLFCDAYGNIAPVAMIWWVAAIFSDIIFDRMNDRFPMLFTYGQKGTGKGMLLESLMKMFGPGQKQLMLGGASTVVGFMRKSGQYVNALVWFDEYKNNLKPQYRESLKNLYDRKGYERGKKDNSMQTESTSVDSAIAVSGQEMPTGEEALFTRFILLTKLSPGRDAKTTKSFADLKNMEKEGLSQITVDLLFLRSVFKEEYKTRYKSTRNQFETDLKDAKIIDRLVDNYACLITVADIIQSYMQLPFTMLQFKELCANMVKEQFYILKGSDTVGKFWSVVETLFEQQIIKEDRHFKLMDGKLYIRIQDIYQHYAELMNKRRDDSVLDHATLRNYLEHNPQTYVETVKKSFGGSYKWCMVFNYPELGIDMIQRESKFQLLSKYREMGIAINESDLEMNAEEKQLMVTEKKEEDEKKFKPVATPFEINNSANNDDLPF